jgi:branched-chain amino acid transport system permease protein
LTLGVFFILGELILINWGSGTLVVKVPDLLDGSISFLGIIYPVYRLFILGTSFLVLLGMFLLLTRTRIGIIIRASVSHADMVGALGTNVPIVFTGVFTGGIMLAAFAGVIAAPFLNIHLGMGMEVLLDCFVVIVIGGFGSLLGAFVASLMIGQLQSFGILWIQSLALLFQFLLMVGVFIFRPTGLFGEKE